MQTYDEVMSRSELRRTARIAKTGETLYSRDRIRRRTLCEAICEGIEDSELLQMNEKLIASRVAAEIVAKPPAIAAPVEIEEKEGFPIVPLAAVEEAHILNAVKRSSSMQQAADLLGIGKTTLYRKYQQYERVRNSVAK